MGDEKWRVAKGEPLRSGWGEIPGWAVFISSPDLVQNDPVLWAFWMKVVPNHDKAVVFFHRVLLYHQYQTC